jgi:hypothetical protein
MKLIIVQPSEASCCFSVLGPNIPSSTLFSNILNLCSSHSVRGQVSHPYKTTGKIIVLYILVLKILETRQEDQRFRTEWQQAFTTFTLLLISS